MSRQNTMYNSKVMVFKYGYIMFVLFMFRFMNTYHGKTMNMYVITMTLFNPNIRHNDQGTRNGISKWRQVDQLRGRRVIIMV